MEQHYIDIVVRNEAGYAEALYGVSLNKDKPIEDMPKVCEKLAFCDGGHNKFLEQIILWVIVTAPRYWWQEADTFRLSSKSSQSTMHTILHNKLTKENFELNEITPMQLNLCNSLLEDKDLVNLKRQLPECFLQRRLWMFSYKTLRNIILQRRTHRLPHWRSFCSDIISQVQHPELLPAPITENMLNQLIK